jgi:hypothetical protein
VFDLGPAGADLDPDRLTVDVDLIEHARVRPPFEALPAHAE